MSAPVHILYETQTPISIDVPVRPAVSQTVALYRDTGAEVFAAQNATLSTISTTLSGAHAAGGATLTVANATGISHGMEFWVRTPDEKCVCRTLSSTTVTLQSPLLYAHANGVTVQGTRLTYTVTAAQAGTLFWDGFLDWVVDNGNATERHYRQHCICTKYPFYRMATSADIADEEPLISQVLDSEQSVERLLDAGLNAVISRVAAKTQGRAWVYAGPHQFKTATVLAALMIHYRKDAGATAEVLYNRYADALNEEIDRLMSFVRTDTDQDDSAEADEQRSARSVRLYRS